MRQLIGSLAIAIDTLIIIFGVALCYYAYFNLGE